MASPLAPTPDAPAPLAPQPLATPLGGTALQPVTTATTPPTRAARAHAALQEHAWQEAFDLFTQADKEETLSGADLEAFAVAAFFSARVDIQIEAKERAFKAHLAADEAVRAATVALELSQVYAYQGKSSIASGWVRRAERLLDGKPESNAHGYLALAKGEAAKRAGDTAAALELAEEAVRIGMRAADADLQATAQIVLGGLKIVTGDTTDGLGLMEEATIAAVNGELSPFTTGVTYCSMISACRDLSDYQRAAEWTEATERWCEKQSVSGFPGICRVHRAEVIALGGSWDRAESELRTATKELAAYNATPPMADGYYALGELRFRMGELDGAEEALRQAHLLGRSPQPALARIRMARGDARAAARSIKTALQEQTWDRLSRVRLLPAQAEIALATGDAATAREAAEELDGLVEAFDSPALRATRHEVWGRVLLAEGDAVEAARELRGAITRWREVAAPYEVARARVVLASALRQLDDDDEADLELEAARAEFVKLGARLDAAAAEEAQRLAAERRAGPVVVRKTFMFTDIVGSTRLAEALGDEAWERLLGRHDDAIRALVAKGRGEVVNSTGDGFFVAFDSARRAIDCAIAIQRELKEQERSGAFALSVRIGVHSAEASRRGADYSGIGVHLASRVASLAEGGEIVATAEVLSEARSEAGDLASSDPREVSLRGVSAPVSVVSIAWA
jgi:class 3 adenylate cyclase